MKKAAVIKILEKYDIDEYHWKLEIADEIIALEITDKCHKIYNKIKEAWTPDKRPFEQAEQESKAPYPDTEADGYVFCGKCGKMK